MTYILTYFVYCCVLGFRMAPEVIACDENPDATYDNRVNIILLNSVLLLTLPAYRIYSHACRHVSIPEDLSFLLLRVICGRSESRLWRWQKENHVCIVSVTFNNL